MPDSSYTTTRDAVDAARRFVTSASPEATVAFPGGSWPWGTAHEDSGLDLCVVDPAPGDVFFEATPFEDWIKLEEAEPIRCRRSF